MFVNSLTKCYYIYLRICIKSQAAAHSKVKIPFVFYQ